ncbi:MAG: R3H domain-containing nucleic acid-binding protein [Patescibacteria group bacterium]
MTTEEIKDIIEEILKHLTIPFNGVDIVSGEIGVVFMINTDEARFLIGNNGANLIALNHVVKRIVDKRKKEEEFTNFTIDVNSYQKQRNEELQNKAKMLAERAKSLHVDVEMEPMTPYERMVVHTTLAGDLEVETASVGFGKDRKVVIKYKNTN